MSSPPPLRHPVPTHPAYIPEPPSTPGSPNGYQRFSSSPGPNQQQQPAPLQQQHVPAYMTSPFQHSQQQQQQHSLNPPQLPHQPSFVPQPDFAAWGVNDATAQFEKFWRNNSSLKRQTPLQRLEFIRYSQTQDRPSIRIQEMILTVPISTYHSWHL
ncbi:YIF1-domain-containing protein [Lentinula edodes]|uniref:YIF1-domain-containing protein n=1 Tax=Lentinula edodes TaxID=5353 RepID=A0A1Q3EKU9_LENED|nr:YIF1-domain-containing protein [Lentinula edodes]